ncbi:SIR2 family protein [Flavobacterium aestuarii]|uniref:SIR2 family protein n=1 Tax=Flavobacterium aestuarii TaxID=3149227 RepID=UPI0032B603F6
MIVLKNKKKTIEIEFDKLGNIISTNINGEKIVVGDKKLDLSNGKKISLLDYVEKEKRDFYTNLLQSQYSEIENIVILSGAGSSVDIGKTNKGLTMAKMWTEFESTKKPILDKLIKEAKYTSSSKDLELLLTEARIHNSVNKNLDKEILEVKNFIVEKCTLELPDNSPHEKFLNRITLRPQKYPRSKLFTLNYDTLFEQAASESKFTVIDGFTFSNPREFNGKYFDYDIIETRHNRQDKKDSTISKLFYLFKMHGSLSWQKKDKQIIQADSKSIPINDRVMIFPQDSKYEHSYEQPYFEMMARFQQTLRTENTLLITIGFSFVDKHISSVILESLKQNPSLNLMSFSYPEVISQDNEYQKELHKATEQSRITLVAETFEKLADEYPENNSHKRTDILEELGKILNKK